MSTLLASRRSTQGKPDDIDRAAAWMGWNEGKSHDEIMQRDGQPFFWPSKEAA